MDTGGYGWIPVDTRKIIRVELRALQGSGIPLRVRIGRSCKVVVQSLNSPFFQLHIGAEPVRAKKESMITCMHMLRTPLFVYPKSGGKKPYLEVLSRFGLWRDNIQATISASR